MTEQQFIIKVGKAFCSPGSENLRKLRPFDGNLHLDKNLLKLTSSTFEKPKTNLIGAGGQMYFTFSLQKGKSYPVSTKIQFKYARSWEPGSGEMKNVTVHFIKK